MTRPRVLLADDHSLILTGMRSILEPEFEVIGAVANGRAAVDQALRHRPDLLILDVTMPELGGIEAAREIKQVWAEAKLLFVSMHSDPYYLGEALDAGAMGYLLKSSANEELRAAVRSVLQGEVYVTKSIPAQVREALAKETRGRREGRLTDRQKEVLRLLAEGRSNKEIAVSLGVSVKTVEFHRGQMMRALGVHTAAELTRFAVRLGLVEH